MSVEDASRCRECNGALGFVAAQGPIETYQCVLCGAEMVGVMTPPIEDFIRSLGPRGLLRVRWGGKVAGAKETHALRQLVPELQFKTVPETLALLRGRSEWVVDELTRNQAKTLAQKAIALGLEVAAEFD